MLGELAEKSRGAGEVGRLSGRGGMDEGWEGRIRAVQWEANPKGGMEGEAEGVDETSCTCETRVRMTQLGWESCRPG